MNEDLYQCTARRLATLNPETLDADDTTGEVREWFEKKGYDYAPVLDDGEPIGYVGKPMLIGESDDKSIESLMINIKLQNIISSDDRFYDVLQGLEDEFFYFLGGRNEVTGIVTRADLNTSPARIHLFDRISLLERGLKNLIDDIAPNWEEEVYFDDETLNRIDRLYAEAKEANVELSKINYASFAAIAKVITHQEDCWKSCGYSKEHKAKSDLHKIRKLRNDVAHSNLILQTTGSEYDTEGRSIRDLIKIYDALVNCNRSLCDQRE